MPRVSRRGAAAVALALLPAPALAHSFPLDAPASYLFVLGTSVAWSDPAILLMLVPLAIGCGLWGRSGLLRILPYLLAGGLGGALIVLPPGPGFTRECVAAGLVLAVLVALLPPPPGHYMRIGAVAVGALVMLQSLEGHGTADLPWAILAGLVAAPLAILAAGTALVLLVSWALPYGWVRIGWRVAASWTAAVAAMYGAFLLR
ncbi:hypothetical protein [Pseudooceanicola sp. LIPI14-2-Ac024]|uniref:hypothetical protein n=1 Tax=Pseudooceanicola sp. LIPI14-2-Ac024 TaxID=3344875 RepID=UPI0035CF924A